MGILYQTHPGSWYAGYIALLVFACAAGWAFPKICRATAVFLKFYPLRVVEDAYPGCHASWLRSGVMLTSKSSGRAVAEVSMVRVRTILSSEADVLSRICLRFTEELRPVES